LGLAVVRSRPWEPVVDEHHTVSNEYFIFNGDTFADEGMRRYLATRSYPSADLNLNKCADPRFISDDTAIEIDQVGMKDPDLLAELNAFTNRHRYTPLLTGNRMASPNRNF
jgi:hypothetical protein